MVIITVEKGVRRIYTSRETKSYQFKIRLCDDHYNADIYLALYLSRFWYEKFIDIQQNTCESQYCGETP